MHEIKIMESVVSILEDEVRAPEIGEVKTVHLRVGKLRYIIPDIMITGFKHIPKSRKLEKARLLIEEIPVRIKCSKCNKVSEILPEVFKCSFCDCEKVEVVSGEELMIKGIEW